MIFQVERERDAPDVMTRPSVRIHVEELERLDRKAVLVDRRRANAG
jgi:hypothetical protein